MNINAKKPNTAKERPAYQAEPSRVRGVRMSTCQTKYTVAVESRPSRTSTVVKIPMAMAAIRTVGAPTPRKSKTTARKKGRGRARARAPLCEEGTA